MSWLHLMNFVLYHHHMWSNHNEWTISQLIIIVWFKLIFLKLICEVNSKIYLIKELQLQQIYWKCVRSENKIKFYRPCLYEGSSTFLLVSIYRYYLHINVYIQSVLLVPVNYCLTRRLTSKYIVERILILVSNVTQVSLHQVTWRLTSKCILERSLILVSNVTKVSFNLVTWRLMKGYRVKRSLMDVRNVARVSPNLVTLQDTYKWHIVESSPTFYTTPKKNTSPK